ncbi:unnamed protein product [Rhizophagus irregularis]|nr:unnamed protein product [Rhizophagus irregularis]
MLMDNMLREVTRGLINDKWINACNKAVHKSWLREIFDLYMIKLQCNIWVERCNETIEIEKHLGIFKDLKRKKRIEENDEVTDGDNGENINKNKNRNKKIKKLIKIDLENNMKNDVFSLGSSNRHRIGNNIISNLVNA